MRPLAHLPEVRAASEALADLALPEETLATCERCAMAPSGPARERRPTFAAAARCCTYHPTLPNYHVGRALRRGGPGADAVRARLADPEGVTARWIAPPRAWIERYRTGKQGHPFGNDEALTCPYWVAGSRGCTIHADRESVCRTWHCRFVDGGAGHQLWQRTRHALGAIEDVLAWHLAQAPDAPTEATVAGWEAWFVACAARVDALTEEDLARLRLPGVRTRAEAAVAAASEIGRELPELVGPSLRVWFREEGAPGEPHRWVASAWSSFDLVDLPSWIFVFFSQLDGRTPWRVARDRTAAECGVDIPDAFVEDLWRRRLLSDPQEIDATPGVSVRVDGELVPEVRLVAGAPE